MTINSFTKICLVSILAIVSFSLAYWLLWKTLSFTREPWSSGWVEKHIVSSMYIGGNSKGIKNILTQVFDSAKQCKKSGLSTNYCEEKNKEAILYNLIQPSEFPFPDSSLADHFDFPSTYFVRISQNGFIEKIYLSGTYSEDKVASLGEAVVWSVLNNPTSSNKVCWLSGLFGAECRRLSLSKTIDYDYLICIGSQLPGGKCLNDFSSDAEDIIFIRDDRKILGAIVRLYGQ